MRLIGKTSQNRRDFWGNYACESCGHIEKKVSGYDDTFFHTVATPKIKCKKCGKSTNDLGLKPQEVRTKYKSYETV
jgi:C4-type Zn-finger protein